MVNSVFTPIDVFCSSHHFGALGVIGWCWGVWSSGGSVAALPVTDMQHEWSM